MATIRPSDLPTAASVNALAAVIVDTGAVVEKATPTQIVNAAAPLASQVEAETGTDNTTRMSPLRVSQAIASLGVASADFDAAIGELNGASTSLWVKSAGAVYANSDIPSINVPSPVDRMAIGGFASLLDGGHGYYKRVGSDPGHAAAKQDASGQWWELDEDITYVEQFGAVADANPNSLTGSETDNAAAINDALAYGALVRCRFSSPTQAFGFKSQIQIGKKENVFGNTLSPNGFCMVALPDYATAVPATAEPVVVIEDERGGIDGLRVVIPTALWDPATSIGTEVHGVSTTAGKYKARVHNCDVIGGEQAFIGAGLEGDFRNIRGKDAAYGFYNTGYDNEFSSCCEFVENMVGFYSDAGGEGSIHCVRNTVASAQFVGSVPYNLFVYDDTPYAIGIECIDVRNSVFDICHINVGQNRADPATEPAVYFRLQDSYNNRFTSRGISPGSGSSTNVTFIEVDDSGGAAAAGVASVRNVFEGYRLASVDVGSDDTQRGLIARNRFERCSGPFIGRYNANGGELIGEGVALSAGGTRNFTVYLPRNPGTQANTTMIVEGRLIMRSGTNKRCVKRVFVSLAISSAETLNEATLTELYKSTGNTDTYNETITSISYSATPNSFTFTFTGPSAHSCTAEFVWDKFLVNQGAF